MTVEIWGFHLLEKRALLLAGGDWYVAAAEKDWRPTFLCRRTGGSSHPLLYEMEPVHQGYESLSELLERLEEAFSSRAASSAEVRLFLLERPPRRESRDTRWEKDFLYLIPMYQKRLDALFDRYGCPREASLSLIAETFTRVYRLGPLELKDLPVWLADVAQQVFREQGKGVREQQGTRKEAPSGPPAGTKELEPKFLERFLLGLDRKAFRCLSLWAASGRREDEIADLLRLEVGEVRIYLETAAERLGRSRDQLRDPALAQALKRVSALASPQQKSSPQSH